eukprot:NODE_76_length_23837_cov_1.242396.p15 type:complete len:169 gc:universal NODE_76_length_23837_cov_1.242396:12368-11862(-)
MIEEFDFKSLGILEFSPFNINKLRMFNHKTFPVRYHKSFYTDVVEKHGSLSIGLTFKNNLIGTLCCRIQKNSLLPFGGTHVYLMIIGVDTHYRNLGLGSRMLNFMLEKIDFEKEFQTVSAIYLHVQVTNTAAIEFYKKHGFICYTIVRDYYQIEPKDAYVLYKTFERE